MNAITIERMQREFPLFSRVEAPAAAPAQIVRMAKTYRQAVRLCRLISPRKLTPIRTLAADIGLTHQHASDYFHEDDKPTRRSLPPERIRDVENYYGNTVISQWIASRSRLTVLEEVQAQRSAA